MKSQSKIRTKLQAKSTIRAKILDKSANPQIRVKYIYIYNCSPLSGIFPDDWKLARVSTIYKSGDKQECDNSVIAKTFEKLVYGQLNCYFKENQIRSTKFQSGFRESHSTTSYLLFTTNSWLVNMDGDLINAVLFLDLKKAFDTVDHQILVIKLELYGIKYSALAWFSSYTYMQELKCIELKVLHHI